ncbi:unnamed protein product, partial [Eruca vesicaria subsp. sativa]|nr:unnamed protein product [Eruca vesicaria subsp. sativa]
ALMHLPLSLLSTTIGGQKKHDGNALLVMDLIICFIMVFKHIIQNFNDVVSYVHGLPRLMEFGLQEVFWNHQGGFSLGRLA